MSVPNTSVKGKIFLLVIILFACIGLLPITTYYADDPKLKHYIKDNKSANKKNTKNTKILKIKRYRIVLKPIRFLFSK
mgnify:CR=1 FL=1